MHLCIKAIWPVSASQTLFKKDQPMFQSNPQCVSCRNLLPEPQKISSSPPRASPSQPVLYVFLCVPFDAPESECRTDRTKISTDVVPSRRLRERVWTPGPFVLRGCLVPWSPRTVQILAHPSGVAMTRFHHFDFDFFWSSKWHPLICYT